MHRAVKSSIIHHFADDTNLLFSSKNPKEIAKALNSDLKLIFEWLSANSLSLNVAKTEFIIFRPPKSDLKERIVLKLNGTKLYESPKVKYVGVILDTRLRWNHHINELSKKLNRAVGMIFKLRNDCTLKVLQSLYYSLFHCHLSYGLSVWGNSDMSHLSKVFILQNKFLWAITFSNFSAHTAPIFKKLGILPINELIHYKIVSLMWDFDHGLLLSPLFILFTRRSELHNRNLRDGDKNLIYTANRYNNRYGYNSFSHNGAQLLNKVKKLSFYDSSVSKASFLKRYKCSILENY